jgi:hypothetical protein
MYRTYHPERRRHWHCPEFEVFPLDVTNIEEITVEVTGNNDTVTIDASQ